MNPARWKKDVRNTHGEITEITSCKKKLEREKYISDKSRNIFVFICFIRLGQFDK